MLYRLALSSYGSSLSFRPSRWTYPASRKSRDTKVYFLDLSCIQRNEAHRRWTYDSMRGSSSTATLEESRRSTSPLFENEIVKSSISNGTTRRSHHASSE